MSTLKVGEIKHESFTGTTQLKLDSAGRLMVGTDTKGLPMQTILLLQILVLVG